MDKLNGFLSTIRNLNSEIHTDLQGLRKELINFRLKHMNSILKCQQTYQVEITAMILVVI